MAQTQTQGRERRTPQQWAALVEEYEASGESQRAFCARRGIGQSSLRYWLRRLGRGPGRPAAAGDGGTRLVAVQVRAEAAAAVSASGVVVVAGGGTRIEVQQGFDAPTLARVVAALGGQS